VSFWIPLDFLALVFHHGLGFRRPHTLQRCSRKSACLISHYAENPPVRVFDPIKHRLAAGGSVRRSLRHRVGAAILYSCLIAGCSGTVPRGESTGDEEAQSTRLNGKLAPTKSSRRENGKEELPIGQKVGVEQKPKTSDVLLSFVGEVKSCVPLPTVGAGGVGALIVSNDPRYVMIVAVVAATKEDPLLRPGADLALAVHSPILLFRRDCKEAVAKRFAFRLYGTLSDGQRQFFHVDAEEVKAGEQPSGNAEKSHK